MNQQIERQVELLTDAKNIMVQHSQGLNDLNELFNNGIISLDQDELNHDYMEYLLEVQAEYNRKLRDLISEFEDTIIPTINNHIQYLENR